MFQVFVASNFLMGSIENNYLKPDFNDSYFRCFNSITTLARDVGFIAFNSSMMLHNCYEKSFIFRNQHLFVFQIFEHFIIPHISLKIGNTKSKKLNLE